VSNTLAHAARRIGLGIVLPAAIVILALLPLWLFEVRLPEPLASHWNMRGIPNGAMSRAKLALIIAVFAGGAAVALSMAAFRRRAGRGEITGLMAVASCVGGLVAAMSWATARANLDIATWKQASPLGVPMIALCIGVGITLGAVVARVSRTLETEPTAVPRGIPTAGLAPGARAMWVGTARTLWAAPLAIILFAIGLALQFRVPGTGLLLLAVGAAFLLFTSIRVTVDRNGVRIAYGLLGWPVQRIALAEIQQASMLQVKPMEWGGWGYRGSMKLMRRAAIVLRAGEGIRLELAGQRTLVITVDDAEQGAGVINDLIDVAKRGGATP
jgi:uncharacterized membrane protein